MLNGSAVPVLREIEMRSIAWAGSAALEPRWTPKTGN
jgi:hypothetical protein